MTAHFMRDGYDNPVFISDSYRIGIKDGIQFYSRKKDSNFLGSIKVAPISLYTEMGVVRELSSKLDVSTLYQAVLEGHLRYLIDGTDLEQQLLTDSSGLTAYIAELHKAQWADFEQPTDFIWGNATRLVRKSSEMKKAGELLVDAQLSLQGTVVLSLQVDEEAVRLGVESQQEVFEIYFKDLGLGKYSEHADTIPYLLCPLVSLVTSVAQVDLGEVDSHHINILQAGKSINRSHIPMYTKPELVLTNWMNRLILPVRPNPEWNVWQCTSTLKALHSDSEGHPHLRLNRERYLALFRGYRMQVSGNMDGHGDYGSSPSSLGQDLRVANELELDLNVDIDLIHTAITLGHTYAATRNYHEFWSQVKQDPTEFNKFMQESFEEASYLNTSDFKMQELMNLIGVSGGVSTSLEGETILFKGVVEDERNEDKPYLYSITHTRKGMCLYIPSTNTSYTLRYDNLGILTYDNHVSQIYFGIFAQVLLVRAGILGYYQLREDGMWVELGAHKMPEEFNGAELFDSLDSLISKANSHLRQLVI